MRFNEHNIFQTYSKLPSYLQRVVTRTDILFVLETEEIYDQLAQEKEINITAFMSRANFISRKAKEEGRFIAKCTITAILEAENAYYTEMMPILYF